MELNITCKELGVVILQVELLTNNANSKQNFHLITPFIKYLKRYRDANFLFIERKSTICINRWELIETRSNNLGSKTNWN